VPKERRFWKAATVLWATAHEGTVLGGVSDHGMHEEDGPGTWEAPIAPAKGKPKARETGAEAEGDGESEGCIRAETVGNGGRPDPPEQKAARVEVSFRRET
jgi:hypothetical protein